jgi:hypothetical protein
MNAVIPIQRETARGAIVLFATSTLPGLMTGLVNEYLSFTGSFSAFLITNVSYSCLNLMLLANIACAAANIFTIFALGMGGGHASNSLFLTCATLFSLASFALFGSFVAEITLSATLIATAINVGLFFLTMNFLQ